MMFLCKEPGLDIINRINLVPRAGQFLIGLISSIVIATQLSYQPWRALEVHTVLCFGIACSAVALPICPAIVLASLLLGEIPALTSACWDAAIASVYFVTFRQLNNKFNSGSDLEDLSKKYYVEHDVSKSRFNLMQFTIWVGFFGSSLWGASSFLMLVSWILRRATGPSE